MAETTFKDKDLGDHVNRTYVSVSVPLDGPNPVAKQFGVESIPIPSEAKYYSGTEAPSIKPVAVTTQSQYYASAIRLAYCEPTVAGFEIFLFEDEHPLAGWQSGLYYANAKPKPSLGTVKWAAARTRGSGFAC